MDGSTATIIAAIFSSGALSALVSGLMAKKASKKTRAYGIEAGVRMLLYEKIKSLGKQYIARGTIHPEELEDILRMHEIYHNELNGNGFLDALMYKVKKLPVTDE